MLLYLRKKYKEEGRSIKYLDLKVGFFVGFPIILTPLLLSDLSILAKAVIGLLMAVGMVAYRYGFDASSRSFRRLMGWPPEDEHTGEAIKDEKKE
jgi:hypothetical protein